LGEDLEREERKTGENDEKKVTEERILQEERESRRTEDIHPTLARGTESTAWVTIMKWQMTMMLPRLRDGECGERLFQSAQIDGV
jgi:hypothetical protein